MYSTEINGEVFSFGTSGLLYRSNKLMYDRGTETLWVQFYGTPAIGPLAGSGLELEVLPHALTTWREWLALHPDTTVLDIATGLYPTTTYQPEYDPTSPYYEYRTSPDPIFPVYERSTLLPDKELILGVNVQGLPKAYPLRLIQERGVVEDVIGQTAVVVLPTDDGQGARVYESGALSFSAVREQDGTLTVTDGAGRGWRIQEQALVLEDDPQQTLPRLEARVAYWFGWFQFHPTTTVYE